MPPTAAIGKKLYVGGSFGEDDPLDMKLGHVEVHPIPAERAARHASRTRRIVLVLEVRDVYELEDDE